MVSNYKNKEPSSTTNQHHEEVDSSPSIEECQNKLLNTKKPPSKQPPTLPKSPATLTKSAEILKEIPTSFPRVLNYKISSQQTPSISSFSSRTRSHNRPTSYVNSHQLSIATRTRSKTTEANAANLHSTSMLVEQTNKAFHLQKNR